MALSIVEDMQDTLPAVLHFTEDEFAVRQRRVRDELERRGLDGILVSRMADQYWLCGLDTASSAVFHSMFVGTGGAMTHLSRSADLANIAYTSLCRDVRLFDDTYGLDRGEAIKDVLRSHGMEGRRIGFEIDSDGMLPDVYLELRRALDGWCELVDTSDLIRSLRLVKSPQEVAYMRRAGELLTGASQAAIKRTVPGAFEGDILAEFQRELLEAGGEFCAGGDFPMGAGKKALLVRPIAWRGFVGENDQVTFEPGAAYRRYQVAQMFTVLTGPDIAPQHLDMHKACVDALNETQDALRPGNTLGEVYEAHRRTLAKHGYEHAALRACGYPMGAVWSPSWMERPMIAENEPLVLTEGMTIFTHMILTDRASGLTMLLGETALVTSSGPEVLAPLPRTPIISGERVGAI